MSWKHELEKLDLEKEKKNVAGFKIKELEEKEINLNRFTPSKALKPLRRRRLLNVKEPYLLDRLFTRVILILQHSKSQSNCI